MEGQKKISPHPICKRAKEIPPCGGGHTFTPLGHFAERIRSAETPPVAELILSHPFGGLIVNLMERDGEDSKG